MHVLPGAEGYSPSARPVGGERSTACAAPAAAGGLGRRRLTHYELLGIAPDERDSAVIEEAGARRSGDVRAYQLTREAECTRLLNAIARALVTLLDPAQRAAYDRALGTSPGPAVPGGRPEPGGRLALMPVLGGAEASRPCDVKLGLGTGKGRWRWPSGVVS
jgi:hypothetical protein